MFNCLDEHQGWKLEHQKARVILLGGSRWMEAGRPMECGAFEEELPVIAARQEGQHGRD